MFPCRKHIHIYTPHEHKSLFAVVWPYDKKNQLKDFALNLIICTFLFLLIQGDKNLKQEYTFFKKILNWLCQPKKMIFNYIGT